MPGWGEGVGLVAGAGVVPVQRAGGRADRMEAREVRGWLGRLIADDCRCSRMTI